MAASSSYVPRAKRDEWLVEQTRIRGLNSQAPDPSATFSVSGREALRVDAPGSAEEGGAGGHSVPEFPLPPSSEDARPVAVVAGLDISFVKDSDEACACMAVLQSPSMRPIGVVTHSVAMEEPYIAGFLAFREVPILSALVRAWQTCRVRESDCTRGPGGSTILAGLGGIEIKLLPGWEALAPPPARAPVDYASAAAADSGRPLPKVDAFLVDGNGVHHPRRCGAAVALGVLCGIRTVGIGKELHSFGALSRDALLRRAARCLTKRGHWMPIFDGKLEGEGVERTGACMQAGSTPRRPIFVSVGHGLSLEQACDLAAGCMLHRLPEPVRVADLYSRALIDKRSKAKSG
ncbi:hypothetical protein FNF28_03956 [Cafeteria roenbergensis]|uniref:Endonuclease V n=1 Tax=Cafeteria roenbergensis TaxID=33653 RepID=A0A5A8DF57_CAFRO|nr:hypothetical protein FNF28_03956 [Cafeteria roenbergensis]